MIKSCKFFFLLFAINLLPFISTSKNLDLIITSEGDSIACLITSVNDSQIILKLKTNHSSKWVNTQYSLNSISDYKYDCIDQTQYLFEEGTTFIKGKAMEKDNSFDNVVLADVKYKELKREYSDINYDYAKTDHYIPGLAALFSIFPGGGFFYVNEYGRGLTVIAGMGASVGLVYIAYIFAFAGSALAVPIGLGGLAGLGVSYIWGYVGSVKAARFKNLFLRDKDISFNLSPKVNLKNEFIPGNSYGLSVSLAF